MRTILDALDQRTLLADGSLARQIDELSLDRSRDLFGADGCLEALNISRPDLVRGLHRAYLEAGADVIRTNTLAAGYLSLAPLGFGDETFYINYAAAEIACQAIDSVPGRGRRRFVLGVVRDHGWEATPLEVAKSVKLQVEGLLAGGADGIVVDIVPGAGRAPLFLRGAQLGREAVKSRAPIFLQSSPGAPDFSERARGEADALICYRHGTANRSDWLLPAVLEQQVNLVGGGASPEETARLDQLLRSIAEDGPRPRTAWQRAAPLDEMTPPSSIRAEEHAVAAAH